MKETKNKNNKRDRRLLSGESRLPDGRYRYRYVDNYGIRKAVYSWQLDETDPLPQGKQAGPTLRQKKEMLSKCRNHSAVTKTLMEVFEDYQDSLVNLQPTTMQVHKTVMRRLQTEAFCSKKACDIDGVDAKNWFRDMQKRCKLGYSTMQNIRGLVHPAYEKFIDDFRLTIRNPFSFSLPKVCVDTRTRRESISKADEDTFLDFVKHDPHFRKYHDIFYVLFHTGLRISEYCGLTVKDIDFKNKTISVNKQMHRLSDMNQHIVPMTKTVSGMRLVPMMDEVEDALKRIISRRMPPRREPVIKDMFGKRYSGFLGFDKNGTPYVSQHIQNYMRHALDKYRRMHPDDPLPPISPHVCRHTFNTLNLADGMPPVHQKYIMGHADIATTVNTYSHLTASDAFKEAMNISELRKQNLEIYK